MLLCLPGTRGCHLEFTPGNLLDPPGTVHGNAGGEIMVSGSIREAYEHGKGPITVRGKAFIEGSEDPDEILPASSSGSESKRRTGRKKVGCLLPANAWCVDCSIRGSMPAGLGSSAASIQSQWLARHRDLLWHEW